jgi:hypothetical protein
MGRDTQTDDWEVNGVAQVTYADGLGAGLLVVQFRSKKANYQATFTLGAVGVGAGGNASGFSGGNLDSDRPNPEAGWTTAGCDRPFSARDLDWSPGMAVAAGGTMGVGFGPGLGGMMIWGYSWGGAGLFRALCVGPGFGVPGVGGLFGLGIWKEMSLGDVGPILAPKEYVGHNF